MTQEELLQLFDALTAQGRSILQKKNTDYAGGTKDPFANFRAASVLGVEPEIALLVRCMDKFQRVRSYIANGFLKAADESVQDSVVDVINYMVLLAGLLQERTSGRGES